MNILQELFEATLHDALDFKKVGTRVIKRKFDAMGIALSQEQLDEIEAKLATIDTDSIAINIPDEQLVATGLTSDQTAEGKFELQLSEQDVDEFLSDFESKMEPLILEIVSETGRMILAHLKSAAPSMLKEHSLQRGRFEAVVKKHWGKALNLLETFIVIALEAGDEFNEEFRPLAAEKQDYVFEALTRLHARACQVASEILTLLRAGYADGAHARWRSLHEIAVVAFFINQCGQEIAERYLLHDAIESYKAAREYQKHCAALGYEPLSEDELTNLESKHDHLVQRFGPSFKERYGWAVPNVGKEKPTFKDIEIATGLEYLRPLYRLASHNVHANPKGVFFKLGLYQSNEDLLVAGPSTAGLADPGHGTAISLLQVTVALLTTAPNLDRLVVCEILTLLAQEIGEALIATHDELT